MAMTNHPDLKREGAAETTVEASRAHELRPARAATDLASTPSPSDEKPRRARSAPRSEEVEAQAVETTTGTTADRPAAGPGSAARRNNVRKLRTERMISKAELARRAGVSTLTVDRIERGLPCRMDTKRKILEALGLQPTARVAVFGDEED